MIGCKPLVPTAKKVQPEDAGHEQTIGGYRLSQEGQLLDQKSLRSVTGKSADWNELTERGAVRFKGNNRWRRYWAKS